MMSEQLGNHSSNHLKNLQNSTELKINLIL